MIMVITNFPFGMDADVKNRLELIAGPRGLNKLLRKITEEWVNEHYPDQRAIVKKMAYYRVELEKLEQYLANMGQAEATQTMEGRERVQFLEDKEDVILNMIWITYIMKRADNEYYNKWVETLQFDSKPELKSFLKKKWEEYGPDKVVELYHKSIFTKNRMGQHKSKSGAHHITLEEYMDQFNIDIDAEYKAGKLEGSINELEDFKKKHLSRQVSL